ncbi:hypothetical protein [Paraburkholderia acidisoli]|uniref:Fis family transcriptional regulator n=1 Tax=Paraburkholderia acidisoli TaxID=2571748 RepID=A0A7Z2GPH3_9BURK|nr:hypothetical protein [Paraburkholderia acidisoli]QGZ65309.1 hypothetical protein FAZ98_26435 [Paraburkholderia acidisoli]
MLPLSDDTVRQRLIGYHMMLANLRNQCGDLAHFVTIAKVVVSASHLFDAGYGHACLEGLTEAHDALERNVRASVERGVWGIDEITFELFADLLTLYEAQLREAPAQAVTLALENTALSRADSVRPIHRERLAAAQAGSPVAAHDNAAAPGVMAPDHGRVDIANAA